MKRILLSLAVAASLAIAVLGIARAQDDADPGEFDQEVAGPGPDGPMLAAGDFSPAAFAHHGPGMGGRGGMGMHGGMGMGMLGPEGALLHGGGRLADELNLSETQRDKLRVIGDGLARKRIQMRADLDLARLDLRSAMRGDSPSLTDLEAKIDAVTRIEGQMMKAGVSARLDARKVLTAEQREKLSDWKPRARGKDEAPRRGSRGGSK